MLFYRQISLGILLAAGLGASMAGAQPQGPGRWSAWGNENDAGGSLVRTEGSGIIDEDVVKTAREPSGLTLSSGTFPPPTEVTTVFSALVTAGIKLSTDLDPSQGKTHAVLFVGSRP